jgi:hypothetical protein
MRFKILSAFCVTTVLLIIFAAGCSGPAAGDGNLSVLVLGENGVPLSGAKVVSNTQPEGQLKVTGLTGSDGQVIFNDIKAGDYEFYVSRFDYEQKEFKISVAAGRSTDITVNLTGASTTTRAS